MVAVNAWLFFTICKVWGEKGEKNLHVNILCPQYCHLPPKPLSQAFALEHFESNSWYVNSFSTKKQGQT